MDYFKRKEVSNSDLGALKKLLSGIEDEHDPTHNYNFGSLVDAMLTEPRLVDFNNSTCKTSSGVIEFSPEDMTRAMRMIAALLDDKYLAAIVKIMDSQYTVFNPSFEIEYDDFAFTLPVRAKLDGYYQKRKMSVDWKTTVSSTQKQFDSSIQHFAYHRQGAWYMDLAGCDSHMIVGISKKNNKIFKRLIKRGDDLYNSGKNEYQYLAFKWFTLIQNFNI